MQREQERKKESVTDKQLIEKERDTEKEGKRAGAIKIN